MPSAEYQSHDGPVDMAATPQVQYAYDDTLEAGELVKGLRPTRVVYPNGRVVRYEYGESGSSSSSSGAASRDPDDCLNRIKFIADDDEGAVGTHLAEYTRLGLNTIVRVDYTEPQIRYDLAHGAGSDPYAGLDRFGRVVDLLWRNYGTAEDVVRIRHGYDRAGNRLYREDPVARTHGVDLDEAYTYDGLYQLKTFVRGALNAQKTAIAAPTFRQAWDFDATGNWSRFREDKDGDGKWDLDQTRSHNAANEITAFESSIGDLWISPLHDRNGNMIRIPQPKDPTRQFTLRYDPWNRLVRVSDPAGPVADYHYDGRNFRILKEVHRDPNDPIPGEEPAARYPETRHFYYNSSWQCLEERLETAPSAVSPTAVSPTADRQFVWGLRYLDDLLLRDRDTAPGGNLGKPNSGLDERLYALQDPNWNVVAIADTLGIVVERHTATAYGAPDVKNSRFFGQSYSVWDWETRYGAYRFDEPIACFPIRRRLLLPHLGQWHSRDPIAYGAQDANLYRYVANRPSNTDPEGLASKVNYVKGMGVFNTVTVASYGVLSPSTTKAGYVGADFAAEWTPNKAAFQRTLPDGGTVQCCNEIGWIQVLKSSANWTGALSFVPNHVDNFGWRVDGGIPYPGGSGNPGIPPAGNPVTLQSPIGIGDQPHNPSSHLFATLQSIQKEFETCVVCFSGEQGIVTSKHSDAAGTILFLDELTVYGCIHWAYHVTRTAVGTYTQTITLEGKSASGGTASLPLAGVVGSAPSVIGDAVHRYIVDHWSMSLPTL